MLGTDRIGLPFFSRMMPTKQPEADSGSASISSLHTQVQWPEVEGDQIYPGIYKPPRKPRPPPIDRLLAESRADAKKPARSRPKTKPLVAWVGLPPGIDAPLAVPKLPVFEFFVKGKDDLSDSASSSDTDSSVSREDDDGPPVVPDPPGPSDPSLPPQPVEPAMALAPSVPPVPVPEFQPARPVSRAAASHRKGDWCSVMVRGGLIKWSKSGRHLLRLKDLSSQDRRGMLDLFVMIKLYRLDRAPVYLSYDSLMSKEWV